MKKSCLNKFNNLSETIEKSKNSMETNVDLIKRFF